MQQKLLLLFFDASVGMDKRKIKKCGSFDKKVYVLGDECGSMHMDCLFQAGNENLFSPKHCTYFALPSEF